MAFWWAMLLIFTYLYVTEGAPPDLAFWMPFILSLFYVFGLGSLSWALSHPVVSLNIIGTQVKIKLRYLFRTQVFFFLTKEIEVTPVREDKDSDGDPYFKLEIIANNQVFLLWESHSMEETTLKRNDLIFAITS